MTVNKILDTLWQDGAEFVSLNRLRRVSKNLYYNYGTMIDYLVSRGFLYKILNDAYYIKSQEEFNSVDNNLKYTPLELLSKALNFLEIKNWYFGLYTALKYHYTPFDDTKSDYLIICDTPMIKKKITVHDREVQTIRLKTTLFEFGIIEKQNKVKYSDFEKTVLDLTYLWHSSNTPVHKIKSEIFKYLKLLSIDRIKEYSLHYPDEIKQLIDDIITGNLM